VEETRQGWRMRARWLCCLANLNSLIGGQSCSPVMRMFASIHFPPPSTSCLHPLPASIHFLPPSTSCLHPLPAFIHLLLDLPTSLFSTTGTAYSIAAGRLYGTSNGKAKGLFMLLPAHNLSHSRPNRSSEGFNLERTRAQTRSVLNTIDPARVSKARGKEKTSRPKMSISSGASQSAQAASIDPRVPTEEVSECPRPRMLCPRLSARFIHQRFPSPRADDPLDCSRAV
jgi:hypothetical protein